METIKARITGCLIVGACGDALGWPVEFLKLPQIVKTYGPEGITDLRQSRHGEITDDTQMTLFTAEGLIRAWVRGSSRGICHPPSVVHHAYLRWLETQEPGSYLRSMQKEPDGWLIKERRLWARRAPGNTCLSALQANKSLGTPIENNSKGCGTVMRAAPFGLMAGIVGGVSGAFDLAAESSKVTHGHPSATFASAGLAAIIALIVEGQELRTAIERTILMLQTIQGADEVGSALDAALRLSEQPDWRKRLPELGEGWIAEEALAIAVFCALAAQTPREALVAAVNHDGDSDSTGSIAGNILGALHGATCVPADWIEQVELRDVIETLADDLTAVVEGTADPEAMGERYPGW